jgi:hypothetical protein
METHHSAEGAAPARTRTVLRRLSLSLIALVFAVFAASALAGSFVVNSSITGSDPAFINPPTGNSPSTCGTATPAPSPRSGTFHYEAYTFRNISQASQCVNVSLAVSSGWATASVYLGSFDPNNPGTNFYGGFGLPGYITQAGDADGFSVDVTCLKCSATVPETFVVVVSEGFANNGGTYTLLVEGTGIIMTGGGPTAAASLQSFRASSAPKGVIVRWRTRSEHEALGFNLYRGDAKKVRLTRSLVRASGNGRGHTYSYLDRAAPKGKAPYYLEVVQRGGSKIMFGPARMTGH